MCVAMLPWAALSLSCSGLCVLPHVHGCPQPGPQRSLCAFPFSTGLLGTWVGADPVCLLALPGLAAGPLPLTGSVAPGEADSAC